MTVFCCPTCGHAAEVEVISIDRLENYLTAPMQRRVLQLLIEHPRGLVVDQFIQKLYGHRADGGPNNAASSVSVALVRMRKILAPLGWAVTKGYGKGGNRPIQLVPLSFDDRPPLSTKSVDTYAGRA